MKTAVRSFFSGLGPEKSLPRLPSFRPLITAMRSPEQTLRYGVSQKGNSVAGSVRSRNSRKPGQHIWRVRFKTRDFALKFYRCIQSHRGWKLGWHGMAKRRPRASGRNSPSRLGSVPRPFIARWPRGGISALSARKRCPRYNPFRLCPMAKGISASAISPAAAMKGAPGK